MKGSVGFLEAKGGAIYYWARTLSNLSFFTSFILKLLGGKNLGKDGPYLEV